MDDGTVPIEQLYDENFTFEEEESISSHFMALEYLTVTVAFPDVKFFVIKSSFNCVVIVTVDCTGNKTFPICFHLHNIQRNNISLYIV